MRMEKTFKEQTKTGKDEENFKNSRTLLSNLYFLFTFDLFNPSLHPSFVDEVKFMLSVNSQCLYARDIPMLVMWKLSFFIFVKIDHNFYFFP